MIPLISSFFRELLYSPERARVWLRSSLAVVFGALAQVVATPAEQLALWSTRDWSLRIGIALILGFALSLKAGEKNPPPSVTGGG